jgi:hypothetical protein
MESEKNMKETAKPASDRHSRLWAELHEKAKDDPQLAQMLEAAKHVMEKYSETFQRLADS